MKSTEFKNPDFSWINLPAKKYKGLVEDAIKENLRVMQIVKAIPDVDRTFENTVQPLEYVGEFLGTTWGILYFLMNAKPAKADRDLAKEAVDFVQNQYLELSYDEDIYKAFIVLQNKKPKLIGAEKKLFEDNLLSYKLMGFGLPKAKRNAVKKKLLQYGKMCSEFSKNINDYKDHILVTKEELDGASESYVQGLPRRNGKYTVDLTYPSHGPFMENVHNEQKRKELTQKFLRKGGQKNMAVLMRMLKTRKEISSTLGFKNHAEYRLVEKMAKDPKTVFKFLNSLIKPLRKKMAEDLAVLKDTKATLTNKKVTKLEQHDMMYLINQDKKRRHNVDNSKVKEYFPLNIVTKGMFGIYEKLFGVKFVKENKIPVVYKDVQTFSVYDVASKKTIGYFFLDLHPREGKYGHAAVFPIIPGRALQDGCYQKPIVGMMCNFAKPTKSTPSLLSHDEVETYFHEFGHLVHGTLTKAKFGTQSGTSVQQDFAEAPSQMLENWVWDAQIINLLSGHYKNPRQKLPKDLLKKMLAAKNHMAGYFNMRQLALATFDMTLHTKPNVMSPEKLYSSIVKDLVGIDMPKNQLYPAGFGHLNGYDAGYYGYMWSKVYASDMFTRFAKEGLLNSKTGRDYRSKVLEPGGSKKSMELVKDFLGRKPNTKAFLKELGL